MGTKVIAVRVGEEPNHTDFTVHEKLICESSEFFKATLGRDWRESKERLVKLPSFEAKEFQIYVQWLYTGRLHVSAPGSGSTKSSADKSNITNGYTLGDFLQDTDYRDTLLE